ncbi:MAG: histidine kinase [Anaerolineaceae bacterium]|nr:histidine kinase [Anaerolineaceae bacterium]MCB9098531.1 histidine kinase [Anaerolineales bacterium]
MLQGGIILLFSLAYIGFLFAIAYYSDKRSDAGRSVISNPYIYALSLAVYCTAWTFYGSVGRAASTGIGFMPIYLGPTLMVALWYLVMRKIIRISKINRITSIADFISSRYGKSSSLAGLVTIIAVVGIIPYISLQLDGVSTSFDVMWQHSELAGAIPPPGTAAILGDTSFYVALLLATFAIIFGTRHLDTTERHEGLVAAIAFESVIKLVAFLVVGVYVTFILFNGFGDIFGQAFQKPELRDLFTMKNAGTYTDWTWLMFLSMMAIMFLPRQFQMTVVENVNENHLDKASWLLPLYLLVINIFVLPIALGGLLLFPSGAVDADTFVLTIPISQGQEEVAMLAFIGGLSAATGMVIVATVSLSTMVSNELVMPLLLHFGPLRLSERRDLGGVLLTIRRCTIILVLMLGYCYFRLTGNAYTLVSIGLISFAAVAQFAPAIFGGIYWKTGNHLGAIVGLSAGFVVWTYTLFLPSLAESGYLSPSFIESGPFGITLLKPYALFGLAGLSPITHSLFWSMLVNAGGYMILSLVGQQSLMEHSQAAQFVDVYKRTQENDFRLWRSTSSVTVLRSILEQFLSRIRVDEALNDYAKKHGLDWSKDDVADAALINYAERLLAGSVGSASARVLLASAVKEEPVSMDEVMYMLDETSKVIAYSRELEIKSKELEQATSELRAANEQLKEVDRLKDDFISTVTHELRTPLTSIRAFSEILHDNPDLDVEQRSKFMAIILKENERLTRLINNVLDLSKIESGKMEWHLTAVDLKEVIEDALATLEQVIKEENIELETALAEHVSLTVTDRDRITQVMLNLLSNAIKFCDSQAGWIMVQLKEQDYTLSVAVSDNGPGIKPENQEIIFEKFRQVGDTLTEKPQGTGLGLPICRQIITYFGGDLRVNSIPGHGATFFFTLPVVSPTEAEADKEPNYASPIFANGKTNNR